MDWLRQVLTGSPDEATIEHLRCGFNTWLKTGKREGLGVDGKRRRTRSPSLMRFMGLPDNPELVRLMLRDTYLREAGQIIGADLAKTKSLASALQVEARRFAGHRWICWAGYGAPPPNADSLDRLLFLAMQCGGGRLPTTARQYATILKS